MIARSCILSALLPLAACGEPPAPEADLNAVLWIQTAAEYRASCAQVFAGARRALETALADPSATAALEQAGDDFEDLPPAIIVDVDETVLDNSAYNARLLEDGTTFDLKTWHAWVREAKAPPIPGAPEFLTYVASRGVTVFYVTNRAHEVEHPTRDNLAGVGCPTAPGRLDTVLTRGEYDTAGSEKEPRRRRVAGTHRVLLILGDDLGDFVPGARENSVEGRAQTVARHRERWGERWFVLPNPIYGSWLRGLGEEPRAALETRR